MKKGSRKPSIVTLGHSITSIRLIAGMFVVSSITLQLIYNKYLTDFIDPNEGRWTLNIVVGLFLVSTFFIKYTRKYLDYVALTLYSIVLSYTIYLTIINEFHPFAITLVVFVMGGGTVIITNIYFFIFQSVIILLLLVSQFLKIEYSGVLLIGLFNLLVSITLFGTVLFVRLKMIEEIKFSHSLLKKMQMFSIIANPGGEIVFVSPSVKSILGYDVDELLGDKWWKNENLSKGWISKEYILNFPGIIHQDAKSTESSVISRQGNVIWLSWSTSILLDGNYMGVAFDVTKYKSS